MQECYCIVHALRYSKKSINIRKIVNMLKCRDIEAMASDYLDKDLSFQQRMAFKLHLFLCHNCRNHVRQLKTTILSIRQLPATHAVIVDDKMKAMAKHLQENASKQ
ncbi:MAG: anti-sigma factor [Methylophaga sp.]|nr:anti-sigma factor [Methylophaga sp.]MAY18918.1 anti-sigma factor [Methylophaga sp.]HAO24235.1 anti-sigma factor [Methylophaga sp.]HCD06136.1 anti-sigma factor [Methylophaga sp.]